MISIYYSQDLFYCKTPPFNPPEVYPEFYHLSDNLGIDPDNQIYNAVRLTLKQLKLDDANFGTRIWNPFGKFVRKGDTILIKPNLVLHEFGQLKGQESLFTHGSVIRAVIDYCFLAVGTSGSIIVADTPLQGADFKKIIEQNGLNIISDFYRRKFNFNIQLNDLRREWAVLSEDGTQILKRVKLEGDPLGYSIIDLKNDSDLTEITTAETKFSITDYDDEVTRKHHQPGLHEYMISNSVLDANLVITMPKLKTHVKAGITVSLKNFVGINGAKDFLAHHRKGSNKKSGDEYPVKGALFNLLFIKIRSFLNERVPHFLWRIIRRIGLTLRSGLSYWYKSGGNDINYAMIGSGGWYGNDTLWRVIYDINKCFFHYNKKSASIDYTSKRNYLSIIDGVVCGEGMGPLMPTPKHCGMIVSSEDPVLTDVVCAKLMGFDWKKISSLRNYQNISSFTAFKGEIRSEDVELNNDNLKMNLLDPQHKCFNFIPPEGWKTNIEL